MDPLLAPIPNLNGNSSESLLLQLGEVLTALHGLEKAMLGASDCWHGRNYQTVPFGAEMQRSAQEAWHQRFKWLAKFERDIEDMALVVQQRGAR